MFFSFFFSNFSFFFSFSFQFFFLFFSQYFFQKNISKKMFFSQLFWHKTFSQKISDFFYFFDENRIDLVASCSKTCLFMVFGAHVFLQGHFLPPFFSFFSGFFCFCFFVFLPPHSAPGTGIFLYVNMYPRVR